MAFLVVNMMKTAMISTRIANRAVLLNYQGSTIRNLSISIMRLHDDHPPAPPSNPNLKGDRPISPRMEEFKKKLREKTPIGKLDEIEGKHPYQEKEPLPEWPNNTNPNTGEVGGPKGPEPTRYGDWERKGRVSDF